MLALTNLIGFGVRPNVPPPTGIEFLATMTSDTAPSPQVASAQTVTSPYLPWRAFDKSNATLTNMYSSVGGSPTGWLAIDAGSPQVLHSYSIAERNDSFNIGAPRDWTVEGSDNGSTWIVVHAVTGQTGWTAGEVRSYTLSSGVIYRHYRLNVSANNGHTAWNIGEWRLFS